MRKNIIITAGILCFITVKNVSYAQDNTYATFINAFESCKPYTYIIGPVDMFGMQVTTKKQIIGIKNGLCSYIEVVGPADAKNTITCNFTKSQINKLVSDMKNNRTASWAEYYNNSKVCKTELN